MAVLSSRLTGLCISPFRDSNLHTTRYVCVLHVEIRYHPEPIKELLQLALINRIKAFQTANHRAGRLSRSLAGTCETKTTSQPTVILWTSIPTHPALVCDINKRGGGGGMEKGRMASYPRALGFLKAVDPLVSVSNLIPKPIEVWTSNVT